MTARSTLSPGSVHLCLFVLVLAAASAACGGSPGPANPLTASSLPRPSATAPVSMPPSTPAPATGSGATIGGTVSTVGASGMNLHSSTDPMIVEVVGTQLSALVNDDGHFELRDVPGGDRQLRFVGGGAHARVEISAVRPGEAIAIAVTVTGTRAVVTSLQRTVADEAELFGAIDAIDAGARTLSVSGRTVQVSPTAVIQRNGETAAFEALRIGDLVEAKGTLRGPVLIAVRIEVKLAAPAPAPTPAEVEFQGLVTAIDPASRSLVVAGRRVLTNGATLIRRRGDPVGFEALRVNQRVEVRGIAQPDGAVLGSRITIED